MMSALTQRIARENLFPLGAACSVCGCSDVVALVAGTEPLLCYECSNGHRFEVHHIAGRVNRPHFVRHVPSNVHRQLSVLQADWPDGVLRNAGKLKLFAMIAGLLGMADYLDALAALGASDVELTLTRDERAEIEAASLWAERYYRAARVLWRASQIMRERRNEEAGR